MASTVINQTVRRLCKRFYSSNPFEIADALDIITLYESLEEVRGYYSSIKRIQFIHINQEMEDWEQRFTCAHELGHAVLHPTANTPFLCSCTLFSVDKLEQEANHFAACLLCPDEFLEEAQLYEYTIEQIASLAGVSEELVRWRVGKL